MKELDDQLGKPIDRYERVKLELKYCIAETDPIKRAILESDIARHNSIPVQKVRELLKSMESKPRSNDHNA
uniref:Uncharacterized protein n=1 Tax=Desertifilum tharense IPPAS B-1220 TaxID=1781255 RepID=A0ACD5H412_9CYAN